MIIDMEISQTPHHLVIVGTQSIYIAYLGTKRIDIVQHSTCVLSSTDLR